MDLRQCLPLAGLALAALAAPAVGQERPLPPERAAIVETASRFASVRWTAEERHVLASTS